MTSGVVITTIICGTIITLGLIQGLSGYDNTKVDELIELVKDVLEREK